MYSFCVSTASILKIVPEVCQAIYDVLHEDYHSTPSLTAQWQQLAAEFENKWQFPNAVSAIDEKHINIKAPPNSGSEYFNYRKTIQHSFAGYCRCKCQIYSQYNCQSDGGVFNIGSLGKICKTDNFPAPCHIGHKHARCSILSFGW